MTSKQILVVEDERPIREMIAFGLRRAGFDVREAEDCRAARAALADRRPDLILIDWMLPDNSGLELTRSLKRERDTRDLPVIMLTARAGGARERSAAAQRRPGRNRAGSHRRADAGSRRPSRHGGRTHRHTGS